MLTSATTKTVLGLAIAVTLLGSAATAQAAALRLGDARAAARKAVATSASYKVIRSRSPLRVRTCVRRTSRVAYCSLYRIAPTPCALFGGPAPGSVCGQVLAARGWLVRVRATTRGIDTKIVCVSDAPSLAAPRCEPPVTPAPTLS